MNTYKNSGKEWTERDDRILIDMYTNDYSVQEICSELLRSKSSVYSRIYVLRLAGDPICYRKYKIRNVHEIPCK